MEGEGRRGSAATGTAEAGGAGNRHLELPRAGSEKGGLVLLQQTRGGPRGRQHGEECLCNTAG